MQVFAEAPQGIRSIWPPIRTTHQTDVNPHIQLRYDPNTERTLHKSHLRPGGKISRVKYRRLYLRHFTWREMRRLVTCRGWKLGKRGLQDTEIDPLDETREEDCDVLRKRHEKRLAGTGFDGKGPPEAEQDVTLGGIMYDGEPFPEELLSSPFAVEMGYFIFEILAGFITFVVFCKITCPYCTKRLEKYRMEKKRKQKLLEQQQNLLNGTKVVLDDASGRGSTKSTRVSSTRSSNNRSSKGSRRTTTRSPEW